MYNNSGTRQDVAHINFWCEGIWKQDERSYTIQNGCVPNRER